MLPTPQKRALPGSAIRSVERRDTRDAERRAARGPQRFMRRLDDFHHARRAEPRERLRSGKRCGIGKRTVPEAVGNQHHEFAVRVAASPRVATQRLALQRQIDRPVHDWRLDCPALPRRASAQTTMRSTVPRPGALQMSSSSLSR